MTLELVSMHKYTSNNCGHCARNNHCFGRFLSQHEDLEHLDLEVTSRVLHKGDHVTRSGQPFTAIYILRSGHVKSVMVSRDGEEQITRFAGPGDIVGTDGLANGAHALDTIVLETASVCAVKLSKLLECGADHASLQKLPLAMLSETVLTAEQHLLVLGKMDAEQRMAAFLLLQSEAQQRNGCSATAFTLSMSRTDIANYLNLAVETVSRLFTRFRQDGLIDFERNEIKSLDIDGLQRLRDHIGQPAERAAG